LSRARDAGRDVLRREAEAILSVMERLNETFDRAIDIVDNCSGRVVLMGVGKSGLICRKIASTLSSVGIPSFFLHPGDSLHGDLGMIQKEDVVIVVSNSGETEEIIKIIPWMKRMGIVAIVVTGNGESTIARYGDVVLDAKVDEACPFNIVPTSSTTATLALGDALAVTLMLKRGFQVEDFASLHPGGTLGRRLFLRVEDLMHAGETIPRVFVDTPMKDVILEITSKRLGVTGVFEKGGGLVGIITDGDLRRAIERYPDGLLAKNAAELMTRNPKSIEKDLLATHALKKMEDFSITSLFVFEKDGDPEPVGVIHIHDLLRAKIA
jgi:arabinose-5-phosphate isomerase